MVHWGHRNSCSPRPAGIALGQDYALTYGYDTEGRFGSVTANVNSTTNVVTYGYVQGSDMMAGWSSNVGMSFRRTFEPNRDLISSVTNAWNATPISSFAYTNDDIGRRTVRIDSGLTQNSFGYNMRSELVNAIMGTNNYGYEYDPIGNRLTATNNTASLSYTANELNQYLEIANGQTIEPSYDDEGNMTAYGDWGFVWNGENRLIAATNATESVSYTYDYHGRMVEKNTNGYTARHIWDDFNIVAEIGANETRYNIWGLDLSQTPQGAGGVGGLLAVAVAGGADPGMFHPAYDANGNITGYADATGDVVATRSYSPFGETTTATGAADTFTHWWSTKLWDPVTGFSEYEFRMYHPALGRWISRDIIGERRGLNLLIAFSLNNPVSRIDRFGLGPTGLGLYPVDPDFWPDPSAPDSWPFQPYLPPISWDPWGPPMCGPDVTKSFFRSMLKARQLFNGAPDDVKCAQCRRYLWTYDAVSATAWDFDWINLNPEAPKSGKCKGCVTFNGKCYFMWDVNYALFGLMNELCGQWLAAAMLRGAGNKCCFKPIYNIRYGDHDGTLWGTPDAIFEGNLSTYDWIRFGYGGGADPVVPLSLDFGQCQPSTIVGDVGINKWPWR